MNFRLTGKISTFGGPDDPGMTSMEGLALYEHHEADLRPDLFGPRVDGRGVAARLRPDALYFAMRFPHILQPARDNNLTWESWHAGFYRSMLQDMDFSFRGSARSPVYGCSIVDFGPAINTGRMFDLSPGLAEALGVVTDDVVTLEIG